MFGWVDLREDEKKRVENRKKKKRVRGLFGWEGEGERKIVGLGCFLTFSLPKMGRN